MDFFEHQNAARKKSLLLFVLFCLAVIAIAFAVWALAFLLLGREMLSVEGVAGTFSAVSIMVGLGSLYRMATLNGGGASVAAQLGGEPLDPGAVRDPGERRLLNVVEEMALASGVPVPQVYVMRTEQAINAFAAGRTPGDAVIGVTRGTIENLSRDELQGVIAHEFSHILNGDMRLNMRLIALLHGILVLAIAGRLLMRVSVESRHSSSNDSKGGAPPLAFAGLGLMIIGGVGSFFGGLIKAAVSRQREFLADASAVQFTRNPEGIAGALKKIGALVFGSKLANASAGEASHLFFGDALARNFGALLATHPPLDVRIRAIDPSFDGDYSKWLPQPDAGGVAAGQPSPGATEALPVPEESFSNLVGSIGGLVPPVGVQLHSSVNALPPHLMESAREMFGAASLLISMMLSEDETIREEQLRLVARQVGQPLADQALMLCAEIDKLQPEARLSFLDLVVAPLRALSHAQYAALEGTVRTLMQWDNQITLFEFVVHRAVLRHLDHYFGMRKPAPAKHRSFQPVRAEVEILLGVLARFATGDAKTTSEAFQAGISHLGLALEPGMDPAGIGNISGFHEIDAALDRLAELDPISKRTLLNGAVAVIVFDHKVDFSEAALLRAISDSLDCPMPPLLPGAAMTQGEATAAA